jgi:DNA-binding NarL/FixJ family response regulator
MTIRVLLVDDHPIVRNGIRALLEKDAAIEVTGAVSCGKDALAAIDAVAPDVLVLDMELPDLSGPEVAQQVVERHPAVKILALSGHDDREYIQELLKLGAAGYLMKEEAPETILEAIRGVANGEQGWVSRRIAAQMSVIMRAEEPFSNLTPRERQVLKLVVDGNTNQGIGAALGISEKTVEKYLESIFTKLDVSSRVEAAVLAVREGLVA